jgi:hypothetical protein
MTLSIEIPAAGGKRQKDRSKEAWQDGCDGGKDEPGGGVDYA